MPICDQKDFLQIVIISVDKCRKEDTQEDKLERSIEE